MSFVRKMKILTGSCIILAALLVAPLDNLQAQKAEQVSEVSPAEPRALAEKLAKLLSEQFVYADVGQKYAAMLTHNADAGKYDQLVGSDLAKALTKDLLDVSPDGHLHVAVKKPAGKAASAVHSQQSIQATDAPKWLAPGIAYVRFNAFTGDKANMDVVRKFVAEYAKAKVVIFDLRAHEGGGLDEMDILFPQLFSKPTPLVRMAARRSVYETSGSPFAGVKSLHKVDGDPSFVIEEHRVIPNKKPGLRNAKVYVLTSTLTSSAAEHFTLALKRTGRGTIVGSHTSGSNHFGNFIDLGHDFTAFIPVGRTFDPTTGKDWEGDGVLPDINVDPDQALNVVLEREGIITRSAATAKTGRGEPASL